MQKGQTLVILLIGILIIAVAGGAFYLGRQTVLKSSPNTVALSQTPLPTVSSVPSSTDETASWKTYVDQKNQFSFKYPSNGHVKMEQISVVYIATNNEPYFTFTVRTKDNPNHLTTKQVVDKMMDDLKNNRNAPWAKTQADQTLQTMKEYTNGQVTGIKLQSFDEGYPQKFGEVVEAKEDSIYTFYIGDGSGGGVSDNEERLLDKILSTFKFL